MTWVEKRKGGGVSVKPPTPTSKKKNETSTPVHTAQIKIHVPVFGTHKLKEIKKERGGGIMGRCFYHHLA